MSVGYRGAPEYCQIGFLRDLLEDWMQALPHDEWGREVQAMWQLLDAQTSNDADNGRSAIVVGWICEELERWYEEDWYENWHQNHMVRQAQEKYPRVLEYWLDRARGFNGNVAGYETVASDVVRATADALPDWYRPDPNAQPLPDPELLEYERLRAKFEGS